MLTWLQEVLAVRPERHCAGTEHYRLLASLHLWQWELRIAWANIAGFEYHRGNAGHYLGLGSIREGRSVVEDPQTENWDSDLRLADVGHH